MESQPEHHLGPSLSLVDGASNFLLGEFVLVRIPERIQVDGQVDDVAFIRQVTIQTPSSYLLEVYPVLSFTSSGGALAGYNAMDDAAKATLLPLPSLSRHHPTPEAFGDPLDFGNWSTFRHSWLSIVPRRFIMPTSRPFKRMNPPLIMPFSVLNRIDLYRETLRSNMQPTGANHHDDQSHPPGSGDEQGNGNLRQGQMGDRGGQVTSGVTSVTSSPTIIGDGGGDKAAGAGLEQFSFKAAHDILVLEGVDEDAEAADATMRDELIMMAHDDPIWLEELRKYLQKEGKERERMQEERAVRLAHWRDNVKDVDELGV